MRPGSIGADVIARHDIIIAGMDPNACSVRGNDVALEVIGYAVKGGGHAWPGGEPLGSADEMGATSQQFDASELIWSFLDRHR